jgi:predicted enzyme related to lactoylglutathione lyase
VKEATVPRRDSAPIGAPCWIELFTSDTDKGRAFYGELFGWTSEQTGEEFGGYINLFKDGVPVGGCMHNDGSTGVPNLWAVYLATDDAQKVTDTAPAHGGEVIVPAMQVAELGSMTVVTDPGGASIGGWQPGLNRGFGILDEPGAPNWFELHTRDFDASVRFYEDVFKWDARAVSDSAEFRYTTLGEGDDALAGIMDATSFLPETMTASWSIYFGVADVDATLSKVADLGGSTVMPAEDTPYGRLATCTDSTDAIFKLRSTPS